MRKVHVCYFAKEWKCLNSHQILRIQRADHQVQRIEFRIKGDPSNEPFLNSFNFELIKIHIISIHFLYGGQIFFQKDRQRSV